MSYLTNSNCELLYASLNQGSGKSSFTAETLLNDSAMGVQARIRPDFWQPNQNQVGRGLHITARGAVTSSGTPTFTINVRVGGAGSTTAAILLGSGAMTTTNNTGNYWELEGDVILTAMGQSGASSTIRGMGQVRCPGFATSISTIFGGGADPGTTSTLDTSITNYINVNASCSVSHASNLIQIKQLLVYGLN